MKRNLVHAAIVIAGVLVLAAAVAGFLASCGEGGGAPPGVESPHQSVWKCWNRNSIYYKDLGLQPHTGESVAPNEHKCTDSEMRQEHYKQDAQGNWYYSP